MSEYGSPPPPPPPTLDPRKEKDGKGTETTTKSRVAATALIVVTVIATAAAAAAIKRRLPLRKRGRRLEITQPETVEVIGRPAPTTTAVELNSPTRFFFFLPWFLVSLSRIYLYTVQSLDCVTATGLLLENGVSV